MNNGKCRPFFDPKKRLQAALDTLEKYTQSEPFSHAPIRSTNEKGLSLSKIRDIAKHFVSATLSSAGGEIPGVEDEVLQAIDDVKRFHPLVDKAKTQEARFLAKRALEAIDNYNSLHLRKGGEGSSLHQRFLTFMKRKKPQRIPRVHLFSLPKQHDSEDQKYDKVNTLLENRQIAVSLTSRETDVFRMKAISLINSKTDRFPTISETLRLIKETPIYPAHSLDEKQRDVSECSIITLEQWLSPLPGETIIVRGSFKRDPTSPTSCVPIPNSFELKTHSAQTGFPYPSQHTGWALSGTIIPPCPLRPEKLPRLTELLEKKEAIAKQFQTRTEILGRSMELWKAKLHLSREHRNEFIEGHHILCRSILASSSRKKPSQKSLTVVSNFFDWIGLQTHPIQQIASAFKYLNETYCQSPYNALEEAWLNQTKDELFLGSPKERLEAAKRLLSDLMLSNSALPAISQFEKPAMDFILLMGGIIGSSCSKLILQYFSELLECPPPQLLDFDKKIQSAAIYQLESFFDELEMKTGELTLDRLRKSWSSDIGFFQKNKLHPLCKELEEYYLTRYTNAAKLGAC